MPKRQADGDCEPQRVGIAGHRSFLTYVATVVHASVDDCGFHVNPERIRSQVEGAAVMGLNLV